MSCLLFNFTNTLLLLPGMSFVLYELVKTLFEFFCSFLSCGHYWVKCLSSCSCSIPVIVICFEFFGMKLSICSCFVSVMCFSSLSMVPVYIVLRNFFLSYLERVQILSSTRYYSIRFSLHFGSLSVCSFYSVVDFFIVFVIFLRCFFFILLLVISPVSL